MPLYDFHMHTTCSDGALSPMELIRRAAVAGYTGLAITDHAAFGGLAHLEKVIARECEEASKEWGLLAFPGVELTHVPAKTIPRAAREAREAGARLVIVHGETVSEPVEPGTNYHAITSGADILAHPGLISLDDAKLAASLGVYLEITSKPTHGITNGHVARMAKLAGARLVLNSDNHEVAFLTPQRVRAVALGAGLEEGDLDGILVTNPEELIAKVTGRDP
jgi:histidinol phosphatase-like PHP family hydrolase